MRRLRGQFRRMCKLRDLIFWTDVGEVGFTDYQKRLKRKQIAIQMATDLHADVTPERALKMISKAIEAQEKHDLAAKRRRAEHANQLRSKPKVNNRRQQRAVTRRQPQARNAQSQSATRTNPRSSSTLKSSRKSSSHYRS